MSKLIGDRDEMPDINERFRFEVELGKDNWRFYDLTHTQRYVVSDESINGIVARQASKNSKQLVLDFADYWNHQPIDLEEDERLLWFVYGAANFLRPSDGQPVILPNGDVRGDLEPHSCRVKLHWRKDSDSCPSKVEFIFDPRLLNNVELMNFESQGNLLDQRAERVKVLQKVFEAQPLMGQLDVMTWTNYSGLEIPQSWSLNIYFSGQRVKTFFGIVDAVSEWTRPLPPTIQVGTLIVDRRFHGVRFGNVNSISYFLKDSISALPQLSDPRLIALTRNQSSADTFQLPPNLRKHRLIVLSLIGIVLAAPFIFLLFQMRRRPGQVAQVDK